MINSIEFNNKTKYIEKIIYSIMEKYNFTQIFNKKFISKEYSKTWYFESLINDDSENLFFKCNITYKNNEFVNVEAITIPLIIFNILDLKNIKLYVNNTKICNILDNLDIKHIKLCNDDNLFKITINNDILCIGNIENDNLCFNININKLLNYINILEDNTLDVLIKNDSNKTYSIALAQALRMSGFKVDIDYSNKEIETKFIITINNENIEKDTLTILNCKKNIIKEIDKDDIIDFLDQYIEEENYE